MKKLILFIVAFKVILSAFFSSDYQNQLFIPFIEHFLSSFGNPWDKFFLAHKIDAFPYHPLMLYIVSLFYFPIHFLSLHSVLLKNVFFKLPTLLSDIFILYLLYKLFPRKIKAIVFFYFASPIILYAAYMHSQLDLIPTALLFFSVYLLVSNNIVGSALIFSAALCTKFHVVAAYPLMLIYIFKKYKKNDIAAFILIPAVFYAAVSLPYIFSKSYFNMVLFNQKQQLILDAFYVIGNVKIYLPMFAGLLIYGRFIAHRKINNDLFYAFLGILFSLLVFTTVPTPAWYLWMIPFLCVFFIKFYNEERKIIFLSVALNVAYLIYFIFFYIPDHPDLTFLSTPVNFKIYHEHLRNLSFTFLEAVLFISIYFFYKFGVKSNLVYKKQTLATIGISGDSGSGKTVLSSDIKLLLDERLVRLEGDADHKWERKDEHWKMFTHLDPKANFIYRQTENLLKMRMGKPIWLSEYDHATGKFTQQKHIQAEDFIIISGIHTFYLPIMRDNIDLKIYVDTDDRLRKHWKIIRDVQDRGYAKDDVILELERRVDDAQRYVHPQKEYADMIIAYFVDQDFDLGNTNIEIPVKLKISLDSGIDIEPVLKRLVQEGLTLEYDYADNLRMQNLVVKKPSITKELITSIAQEVIVNREEILSSRPVWLGGYRGLVQLFVLLGLSYKIKKISDQHEI